MRFARQKLESFKGLIRLVEAAEVCGITADTFRQLWQAGEIPGGVMVGRSIKFDPLTLADWLDGRENGATSPICLGCDSTTGHLWRFGNSATGETVHLCDHCLKELPQFAQKVKEAKCR